MQKTKIVWVLVYTLYFSFPPFSLFGEPNSLILLDAEKTKEWGAFLPKREVDQNLLQSILDEISVRRFDLDPKWLRLVHYESKGKDNYQSKIVNSRFFLSSEGRTNPKSELEATIRSFFVEEPIPEGLIHPVCSYPTRHQFIKQKFGVNFLKRSGIRCDRYEVWKASIHADSVSIVFASYYLMSPASVFGHTMLKFNQKSNEVNGSEILDYAVNVSADTPNLDPIRYTYHGLFGGFKAKFSLFPYYLKVNEYNDLESRDLWEYRLSLNKDELELLVSHLWELSRAEFDYYFLNANCGTFLVEWLDVVKPELNLKSKLGGVVSPVDTIKLYTRTEGLVVETKYRPSLYSEISFLIGQMEPEEKKAFYHLLDTSKNESFDLHILENQDKGIRHSLILDAFLLASRYQSFQSPKPNEIQKSNEQKTLEFRSRFPSPTEPWNERVIPSPPELAHPKSRIVTGGGSSNLGPFLEWKYRFAYHDLLNVSQGSPPNGELVFFDGSVRQYEGKKTELTSFTLVRLVSLSPYNPISKHWSYLFDFGMQTTLFKSKQNQWWESLNGKTETEWERKQVANLDLAAGWTFADEFSKTKDRLGKISFLLGFKSQFHPRWEQGGRFGPNVQTLYQKEWGNWKVLGGFFIQHYWNQTIKNQIGSTVTLRYLWSQESEFRVEMKREPNYQEVSGSFHYLF
ncbi:Lnb N-terminal periplasmic domain-containing protein [Leptospira paudalimensis]|uniref:DUF4105 domain-containing protein n=1 Tax=Leptospira paudalimensis TaxID=2950024 RepID=A0ABT3M9L4_9LEPT|nr:DUF4105 domain-containing protein [Leptospira paudalimensis]MCW7505077.1 DUF4105 domain-containing protein [Leptospira paudalimensis]